MKQLTVLSLLLLMLLVPAYSSAQTASGSVTVTGTVVDEASLPLIGASVNVIGTKPPVGVITDIDGNFELQLTKPDATLEVRYVGYETAEVKATPGTNMEIILKENSTALEEVVAIGYAVTKKSDLTGSVTNVSSKAIAFFMIFSPLLVFDRGVYSHRGLSHSLTLVPRPSLTAFWYRA